MARIFRSLTALAAWAGLAIQLWLLVTSPAFASPVEGIWRFFAFFTILTNLMVAVVMTASSLAPASGIGRFVDTANARAAVLLYIATVGIIYHLLLAGLWQPQGWQYIADLILHSVTPALVVTGWLVFDRKDGLLFRAIPLYLIYPVGYTLYALARGASDGFYPYPFIDVSQIGYPRALVNIAGLTGGFIIAAGLIIAAGKAFVARKTGPVDPDAPAPDAAMLKGDAWVVEDINRTGIIDSSRLTLSFGEDGHVSGSGGCNGFSGTYTVAGATVSFSPLASTRRAFVAPALSGQETKYLAALGGEMTWAILADGALELTGDEGRRVLLRR